MKLGDDALLKLVDLFRQGLVNGEDISDLMRQLDLEIGTDGKLHISGQQPQGD